MSRIIPEVPGTQIKLLNLENLKTFYKYKIANLFTTPATGEGATEIVAVSHGGTGVDSLEDLKTELDLNPITTAQIEQLFQ